MGGGGKSGGGEAAAARADEKARQDRIRTGTKKISTIFDGQFNDPYFDKQKQSYLDYASPQLEDQYAKAQKELTYALARGGNLNSSVRGEKSAELQKQYDLNKQKIADDALSSSTQARNNVESARADLISQLNATGDAEGAANSAINRASALSQPAAFSPITSLFADFTSALGTQAALERASYYSGGAVKPTFNTGLFSPSKNSVKVS